MMMLSVLHSEYIYFFTVYTYQNVNSLLFTAKDSFVLIGTTQQSAKPIELEECEFRFERGLRYNNVTKWSQKWRQCEKQHSSFGVQTYTARIRECIGLLILWFLQTESIRDMTHTHYKITLLICAYTVYISSLFVLFNLYPLCNPATNSKKLIRKQFLKPWSTGGSQICNNCFKFKNCTF